MLQVNPNINPPKKLLFNAYLLMFIVHTAQTGVGIAGLPRVVFLQSENDAWISVLITGAVVTIVLFIMDKTLKMFESADLYSIHEYLFGKWGSKLVNSAVSIYLLSGYFIILKDYTEMVQEWIFPTLPTWIFTLMLSFLAFYAVTGGIRVVVGICVLSLILSIWITFIIAVPLQYMDYSHLLPIWNHSFKQIMMGTFKTSLSIVGYEMVMFVYPFVQNKEKVFRYSMIGNLYSTLLFTLVTFVSIGFFSSTGLKRTIWPVLSMFKIVRIPNLERFEFIAVSFWMLIILPNICLYLWSSVRGIKKVLGITGRKSLYIALSIAWLGTLFLKERIFNNLASDYVGYAGFALFFVYPFLLYAMVKLKMIWKKKRSV
ncbi:GerAB/ArcD/ProY family transporter [Falsibacillus pallidus]|uniref:GerAB/ArcD/ProY family transporter n=1 Tax=Falsibacillus pallidus TaxID=493781 RepID=UPI003D957116